MPPISMNVDYMRRKRPQSTKPEETIHRVLRQFSASPQNFRFPRFQHTSLGVIHPIPLKIDKSKGQTSIPKPATYNQGDKEYMEIKGKKCSIINVEPDIIYTKGDRKQIDDHLVQPFFYVQEIFPRGRPASETALEHIDVFTPFETLIQSKRNNKNISNTSYIKILKSMSQQEREEFYAKGTKMNIQYQKIFKRFMKALIEKGLISPDYKMYTKNPKIPKKQLINQAAQMQLIKNSENLHKSIIKVTQPKRFGPTKIQKVYEQLPISYSNMIKFLQFYHYDPEHLNEDVLILFDNVNVGDSPISILLKREQKIEDSLINFNAFLYNAQKFFKLKYKIKNLLSINAAKQRNVYVKFSLYPFLGEGWKVFKKCMQNINNCEMYIESQIKDSQNIKSNLLTYHEMIDQRNKLIKIKRIWAKNLQKTPLQYILLKFDKVKEVYAETINFNAQRIQFFNQFQIDLFQEMGQQITMNQVVSFILKHSYSKEDSELLVEMLQKIFKYFGMTKLPNKSKWQLDPEMEPEKVLTSEQVQDFLVHYSAKQNEEWKIFKIFLDEFHDFVTKKLQLPKDRLKHVRQAWECNVIGEWLIKKLKKLDIAIEQFLWQSVNICNTIHSLDLNQIQQILETKGKLSFNSFMDEKIQINLIEISKAFSNQLHRLYSTTYCNTADWDADISSAMKKYQAITQEIHQDNQKILKQEKQIVIPHKVDQVKKDNQLISAANLIDDRSFSQEEQILSNQKTKQQQKQQQQSKELKQRKIYQQNDAKQMVSINEKIIEQPKLNLSQVSSQLSEAELDMKIQNAMRLQTRIFSELGNIKDLSFRM